MVQGKLQPIQLFVMIVMFEVGSAVVVGLGLEVKQDAWIAILIGMAGGLCLFSLYVYLSLQFATLPLSSYLEKIVGKFVGRMLAILYIGLFLYIAARVLRDFCDLLITMILPDTPLVAIAIIMMLVICIACYLGVEVIARTTEIFFPWVMFFSFLFVLFVFLSGLPKLENLQPVLEMGWQPIWKAAFPTIVSFPFGESIVFTLFFYYVNEKKGVIIAGYLGIIFSGMILIIATTIMISVLGPYIASNSPFPLMTAVEKINVGEVFNRLDPIAIILLIIGGFFKITIFFCGAVEGLSSLVKKPNLSKFSIPIMGTGVVVMSITMANNYVEHIEIGLNIVPNLLYIPFFMVIPFLLVVIVLIKKKMKTKNSKG